MQWVYWDASALIKRYTTEVGTPLINEVFQLIPTDRMTCSMLGILEVASILVRKRNDSRLSVALFEQAMIDFRAEVIDRGEFFATSVRDSTLTSALEIIITHNLNATDAIILKSALELQEALRAAGHTLLFCAADKRLVRAAKIEGLAAFDPEQNTQLDLVRLLANR